MIFTIEESQMNDLFSEYELEVCILLSLLLQISLIVAGTVRRLVVSNNWIVILLWLAYVLADAVAIFGLGLIVSKQSFFSKFCKDPRNDKGKIGRNSCHNNNLQIFWAPFLLVHLCGPDIITAFSLEDNELWLRQLMSLASQCITVAYIFYQSHYANHQLRIPTLLIIFCAIIKCVERTHSLYRGSAHSFRNSMIKQDLGGGNISRRKAKLPLQMNGNAFSELQVLQYAYLYFTTFKGLIADLIIDIHDRNESRQFFLATSGENAFRLVKVELNFLYDVLFTKIPLLHDKFHYWMRTLSFASVVASLAIFHFRVRKKHYHPPDVLITYILFIGAIALDVIASFMLLFCDWTVVKLAPLSDANSNQKSWKSKFAEWILFVNTKRSMFLNWILGTVVNTNFSLEKYPYTPAFTEFSHSRWAGSLSTFNLIYYCLHKRKKGRGRYYNNFGFINILDKFWYVEPTPLTHHIMGIIFHELKRKSEIANGFVPAKELCSAKGEWVFRHENQGTADLLRFVDKVDYDEILLWWHIATELCYNNNEDQLTSSLEIQRQTAKQLSDYMLYLMVMKPDMMSAVSSIGEIKFQNACAEASKFFETERPGLQKRMFGFLGKETQKKNLQKMACEKILTHNITDQDNSVTEKGERKESILINGCLLAKELGKLPPEERWSIISKVWVEMLSYAASHIKASAHAEQLSKSRELITVVWLLMAHFDLRDKFQINPVVQGCTPDS